MNIMGLSTRNFPAVDWLCPCQTSRARGLFRRVSLLRFPYLFVLLLGVFFMPRFVRSVEAATVCAVLPTPGVESVQQAADLLEAHLAGQDGITLVNRSDFEKVVTEQVLNTAFAADGVKARIELGKMLKADLLIFLRERQGKGEQKDVKAVELSVADTKRGLRLIMDLQYWDPNKAEDTVHSFSDCIRRACRLADRDDLTVFAVPPFECTNISFKHQQYKWGYARLLEEILMRVPHVVVVDFSEAKAISTEAGLSAESVQRNLPYYLLGSYRISDSPEHTFVSLSIRLTRGSDAMDTYTYDAVLSTDMADTLLTITRNIFRHVQDAPPPRHVSGIEAKLLADRGELFRRIGDFDAALATLQSALLLDPLNYDVYTSLYLIYRSKSRYPGILMDMYDTYDKLSIQYADVALDYLAILLSNHYMTEDISHSLRYPFRVRPSALDGDPYGILSDFILVSQRHAHIIIRMLQDDIAASCMNIHHKLALAKYAISSIKQSAKYYEVDAVSLAMRILAYLDNSGVNTADLFDTISPFTVGNISQGVGFQHLLIPSLYSATMAELLHSDSSRLQLIGRLTNIIYDIHDQSSYDDAVTTLSELCRVHQLGNSMNNRLLYWANRKLSTALDEHEHQESQPRAMVPLLTPVMDTMKFVDTDGRGTSKPTHIHDWLNCGHNMEIVATDAGLFIIENNRVMRRIGRWAPTSMYWDGKYVWTIDEKSVIYVIEPWPLRVVACFDDNKLIEYNLTSKGVLTTMGPGRACLARSIWQKDIHGGAVLRSWITMLSIEEDDSVHTKPHARVIYETLIQKGKDNENVSAFIPEWIYVLTFERPKAVAKRVHTYPAIIIDTDNNIVRRGITPWDSGANIIQHEDYIYMTTGRIHNYKEHFEVSRMKHIDDKPETLMRYESKARHNVPVDVYHGSLLIHNNKLHMVATTPTQNI